MCDIKELEAIDLLDRIQARKRQVNSLETKLKRVEFDCERIPLKRKAAYGELFRRLLPTILLSAIEVTCLVVWGSTIISVAKAGGKATPAEGLVILLGALLAIFAGFACVKRWMAVAQVIIYLKDLKDEEIHLATKRITLTEKLTECRAELKELHEKQKNFP